MKAIYDVFLVLSNSTKTCQLINTGALLAAFGVPPAVNQFQRSYPKAFDQSNKANLHMEHPWEGRNKELIMIPDDLETHLTNEGPSSTKVI